MKAAKEEWIEEQCKKVEKKMVSETARRLRPPSGLSPRPNSLIQQSSMTVAETS